MAKVKNNTNKGKNVAKATVSKGNSEGLKVLETVNVKPSDVVLVEKFRGRSAYVSDDEVTELAESIRTTGQVQAIQVRKTADGKYEALFGNTRVLAGKKIEAGYTANRSKPGTPAGTPWVHEANPNFTLRAEVVECSDEEAILRNIAENIHRVKTSPIDDAKNHAFLQKEFGLSGLKIAALYGYSSSASVTQHAKLLTLPEAAQAKIHTGAMTLTAGLKLAEVPDEDRAAVMDKVTSSDEEGKINVAAISEAIAALKKERAATATPAEGATGEGEATPAEGATGEATPATPPADNLPTTALTLAKVKQVFKATAGDSRCPEKLNKLFGYNLDWIEGKTNDADYIRNLLALMGEEFLPVAPEVPAGEGAAA